VPNLQWLKGAQHNHLIWCRYVLCIRKWQNSVRTGLFGHWKYIVYYCVYLQF